MVGSRTSTICQFISSKPIFTLFINLNLQAERTSPSCSKGRRIIKVCSCNEHTGLLTKSYFIGFKMNSLDHQSCRNGHLSIFLIWCISHFYLWVHTKCRWVKFIGFMKAPFLGCCNAITCLCILLLAWNLMWMWGGSMPTLTIIFKFHTNISNLAKYKISLFHLWYHRKFWC